MNFTSSHHATNLSSKLPLDDAALATARSARVPNDDKVGLTDAVRPLVLTAIVPAPTAELNLPAPAVAALRAWISALPKVLSRWPALLDAAVRIEIRIERIDDAALQSRTPFRAVVVTSVVDTPGQGGKHRRRTAAAGGFATVVRGSLQRLLEAHAPSLLDIDIRQLTLTGMLGTRAPSAFQGRDPQVAAS